MPYTRAFTKLVLGREGQSCRKQEREKIQEQDLSQNFVVNKMKLAMNAPKLMWNSQFGTKEALCAKCWEVVY